LLCFCSSCKTPQYIPIESTKIEYRDKIVKDSVFRYDSVFVKQTDGTVFFERYRSAACGHLLCAEMEETVSKKEPKNYFSTCFYCCL
jgi:hypothetical protein